MDVFEKRFEYNQTTACAEIDRLAEERLEKSRERLTREQAFAEVLRERPELYDDYLARTMAFGSRR